jgi:uncharacterized protein YjbI with pentapeptide repeats
LNLINPIESQLAEITQLVLVQTLRQREVTIDSDNKETPIQLDLRGVNLQGADMSGLAGHFDNALFDKSRFEGANFERSSLNRVRFKEAQLSGASFIAAQLNEAVLDGANLDGALLNEARLRSTDFINASTRLSMVLSVDLTDCVNLSQGMIHSMFGNATTMLPAGIEAPAWHGVNLLGAKFVLQWGIEKGKAGIE